MYFLKGCLVWVLMLMSTVAFANNGVGEGYVQQVMSRGDSSFGGCMAFVTGTPAGISGGQAPNCGNFPGWITFDCKGDELVKSQALTNFSLAQLALVTGKKFKYYVREYNGAGGKCLAYDVRATKYVN